MVIHPHIILCRYEKLSFYLKYHHQLSSNKENNMQHKELIKQALQHYSQEQLNQMYIDSSLEKEDQESNTLETHIINYSEDWTFQSNSSSCDVRGANSLDDMIAYVDTTLVEQA